MSAVPLLLALLGCAPKEATPEAAAVGALDRTRPPEPLPERPFRLPDLHEGELSNGIPVVLVENREVPLVIVRIEFDRGSWTDPPGEEGLARLAMDMLDEGAGELDGPALSAALRRLGTTLSTGAGLDAASVSITALRENLEPSLDLLAQVVHEPRFDAEPWEIVKERALQDVEAARQDPPRMARRATSALMYGGAYAGRLVTPESLAAIDREDAREWVEAHLVPSRATIYVGGDATLDEILPLLEARFGDWSGSPPDEEPPGDDVLPRFDAAAIWLVDRPGAPQSVVVGATTAGHRTDPDYTAFAVANRVMGGQFTSRINMNLREDKGWTYGARSGVRHTHVAGLWTVSASVVAEATGPAIAEVLEELRAVRRDEGEGARPITEEELAAARDGWLLSWPLAFELPEHLLDQVSDQRLYGLPDDWITGFPDRVRAVDAAAANAAWRARIDPDRLQVVVVGDAASMAPHLEALGLPVHRLDADGRPVED